MWTISCLYYEACRLKEKGTACCCACTCSCLFYVPTPQLWIKLTLLTVQSAAFWRTCFLFIVTPKALSIHAVCPFLLSNLNYRFMHEGLRVSPCPNWPSPGFEPFLNRIVALLHVFISLTRTVALQLIHVKGHSTFSCTAYSKPLWNRWIHQASLHQRKMFMVAEPCDPDPLFW